ncbi:ATP-binding cassette domain-containing protein [Halalkalibacter krulwichiae]|uniref:ABC transporter ATP-binding protein YtrB n=1 Tax=Halalkalibacter krulwichiae TaxID=199441 RepID=A0A1X9MFX4_9BACI|nr:ABC transporter ATP-binding protein [Halalkalibacter krulwichiae]ARK30421.1 ABC transporter ATP-binding protein YtrB [Halalkalibacter krulwichiae]
MVSVLTLKEVVKTYPRFTLGPLNLNIEQGTAVAVIGPNGSGKSTLFKLIMNIIKATDGKVELFGQVVSTEDSILKQQVGYVGDRLTPFGDLNVKKLAAFISYWYPNWDQKKYEHLVNRYEIDEQEIFQKCSKGTQKKIEFIFALAHNPKLLLLDEPSAGVDLLSQRKMKEDLTNYMESGFNSIMMSSHTLDEIKHLCDYLCMMDNGKVLDVLEKDVIQDNWAKLWVDHLPEALLNESWILKIENEPLQIISNNREEAEQVLAENNVTIQHMQKLNIDEAIEYLLYRSREKSSN